MGQTAKALRACALVKSWPRGPGRQVVLFAGLDLEVEAGETLAIMGPSGTGKSSLLHLLAGLDRAHGGTVFWAGTSLSPLRDGALSALRRRGVGLAMQQAGLIAPLSVRDNVTLAGWIDGQAVDDAWADMLLARLHLDHLAQSRPQDLSGGEAARVAVARALYPRPKLLLCDEPTGALDADTGALVLTMLQEAAAAGAAVITTTHDAAVAQAMGRIAHLHGGTLRPEGSV